MGLPQVPPTGTTGVEERFYTPKEYRALTADQKMELKNLRKQNKINKAKKKKNEDDKDSDKKEKVLEWMVAAFEQTEKDIEMKDNERQ